jgi:hypothetical protein
MLISSWGSRTDKHKSDGELSWQLAAHQRMSVSIINTSRQSIKLVGTCTISRVGVRCICVRAMCESRSWVASHMATCHKHTHYGWHIQLAVHNTYDCVCSHVNTRLHVCTHALLVVCSWTSMYCCCSYTATVANCQKHSSWCSSRTRDGCHSGYTDKARSLDAKWQCDINTNDL